jgi:hypothetical protein
MKNWSRVPDGRLTPRQTGRLIVDRNVTSTSWQGSQKNMRLAVSMEAEGTGEDIADWEDSVRAVLSCWVSYL